METDGSGTLKTNLQHAPKIDSTRCSGCGCCVAACPQHLLTLDLIGHRKTAAIRSPEKCTQCGKCLESCPVGALQ